MRKVYLKITLISIVLLSNIVNAQTTWSGPLFEFTKTENADPTNALNQDQITPSVAITRGSGGEIYNATSETTRTKGSSPSGTEWAIGDLSNIEDLTFSSFRTAVGSPKASVGKKLVLHILEEDVYLSVEFTSWSSGQSSGKSGGGFSYKRSTPNVTNNANKMVQTKLSVFPNPSTSFIKTTGLNQPMNYEIYDLIGSRVLEGIISDNNEISVQHFKKGIYFLKIENNQTIRFIKK
jgi:hypothetical protein